jgi:cytosine/uracil/thiamine/allantoin permease
VAHPTFLDTLYTYAWFVTFGLSFALYTLTTRRSMAGARPADQAR